MNLSIADTCSFLPVLLTLMSISKRICLCVQTTHHHVNDWHWIHVYGIFVVRVYWCGNNCLFSFFISSAVPKCIPRDTVNTKGILLMYIMSTSIVTFLCCSNIPVGRSSVKVVTCLIFLHVALPCSEQKLVPKMSSAHMTSAFVQNHVSFYVFNEISSTWLAYNIL